MKKLQGKGLEEMLPIEDRSQIEYKVLDGLLQHNYLPAQRGIGEELPPLFNSKSFTLPAAEALAELDMRRSGYDSLRYGTTNPNQTIRTLSVPHPLPYAHSALQIASHWDEFHHITENECSHIKPQLDCGDRILALNDYGKPLEQLECELDASLGKSFCVKTDIRQCFSSLPTNLFSIIENETEIFREDRGKPNYRNRWFYKLERSLSLSNCNKPRGLPVGPAGSNVVSEYLLFHIDRELQRKGYSLNRYIDDYICYCDSYEQAELFLDLLRDLLQEYGLDLNTSKTSISALPQPLSPDWIVDLQLAFPAISHDANVVGLTEAIRYLDYALRLQKQNPDSNVLKYAAKTVMSLTALYEMERVYHYVLNLSRQHPSLLPLFIDLPHSIREFSHPERVEYLLKIIVRENAKHRRSDGMVWGLYYLLKLNIELDDSLIAAVQRTRDPMALLCLQAGHVGTEETLSLLWSLQSGGDLWSIDRYWMLFYQFYLEDIIPNPYPQDNAFEIMRFYKMGFIGLKSSESAEV